MQGDIKALLADRIVQCSLRKQPAHLTKFFYARLGDYSRLHNSAEVDPAILCRLFAMLKYIGQPIEPWRKDEMIQQDWPALERDLSAVL